MGDSHSLAFGQCCCRDCGTRGAASSALGHVICSPLPLGAFQRFVCTAMLLLPSSALQSGQLEWGPLVLDPPSLVEDFGGERAVPGKPFRCLTNWRGAVARMWENWVGVWGDEVGSSRIPFSQDCWIFQPHSPACWVLTSGPLSYPHWAPLKSLRAGQVWLPPGGHLLPSLVRDSLSWESSN